MSLQLVPATAAPCGSPRHSARLKVPAWWNEVDDEKAAFPGLNTVQLLAKMDEQFLLDGDMHLYFTDDAGEFLICRGPWNDGLSTDTIDNKKNSIFIDGWIPGIRGGAWVRGTEDTLACSSHMKCLAFHADSLIRSLEAAKKECPTHVNVLKALEDGLPHCKVYHPLVPKWAVRFYKKMGNIKNDDHRVTTIIEIYEISIEGQNAWKRLKQENSLSPPSLINSLGLGEMNPYRGGGYVWPKLDKIKIGFHKICTHVTVRIPKLFFNECVGPRAMFVAKSSFDQKRSGRCFDEK